jgi:tyrosine-protein phosphatase SIW14
MKFRRVPVRSLAASLFAIFLLSAGAYAKGSSNAAFPGVHIKNFGQMDERFYRGAEPKGLEDVQALKAIGINTVIDLQEKPEPAERGEVESLGMRYVNIPMVDKSYPRPEWVAQFLKTVDDPSTGKFFVHCAGGRHRTGSMGAVYRFEKYGWNYDQVYAEMKQYDFYTSWGHGDFKTFVEDYARQMQSRPAHAATVATATGTPAAKAAHASAAEAIFAGNHR